MWRNSLQLKSAIADSVKEAARPLYGATLLMKNCIVENGYIPSDGITRSIALLPAGQKLARQALESSKELSEGEAEVAVFLKFYHHELLVDLENMDIGSLSSALHAEIVDGTIRYPWIFEKFLYDRFFRMFPTRTKELSHADTLALLDGAPQGVFQVGHAVVGPFGLLKSAVQRDLPPTTVAPLWHCSDPSCASGPHSVALTSGSSSVAKALNHVQEKTFEDMGQPSEWRSVLFSRSAMRDHYDDFHTGRLPWLLANAFSLAESRAIASQVVKRNPSVLEPRAWGDETPTNALTTPRRIEEWERNECLQLLLLATDQEIVESAEECIADSTIKIPATETRVSQFTGGPGGWHSIRWECSQFGFRAVSPREGMGIHRLSRLVRDLYSDDPRALEWKLRGTPGRSTTEKVAAYIRENDPQQVIRDLAFDSPGHLESTFAHCGSVTS